MKYWLRVPDGGLIPRQTGRQTVGLKITSILISARICIAAAQGRNATRIQLVTPPHLHQEELWLLLGPRRSCYIVGNHKATHF
jgi:hypothetical protein